MPVDKAVIRIGARRSEEPRITACLSSPTPSSAISLLICAKSMMPLRTAMPKSVMKPISDATESTPPPTYRPITPPTSASGRLQITISASPEDFNAVVSSTRIPAMARAPKSSNLRVALASLSNWPPYSIR